MEESSESDRDHIQKESGVDDTNNPIRRLNLPRKKVIMEEMRSKVNDPIQEQSRVDNSNGNSNDPILEQSLPRKQCNGRGKDSVNDLIQEQSRVDKLNNNIKPIQ